MDGIYCKRVVNSKYFLLQLRKKAKAVEKIVHIETYKECLPQNSGTNSSSSHSKKGVTACAKMQATTTYTCTIFTYQNYFDPNVVFTGISCTQKCSNKRYIF